jgi:hypothetical protein
MRKFKVDDWMERTNNFYRHAPEGYKAKVLEGYKYMDLEGQRIPINDNIWELAEDTSKPVYTQEMYDNGFRVQAGMKFSTEAGEYIAECTNEKSVVLTDENGFLVAINRAYAKPIPAPIALIDGNAYMFDYKCASYIGIYASPPHRFIKVDGFTLSSYCTNIRLMTVAESK